MFKIRAWVLVWFFNFFPIKLSLHWALSLFIRSASCALSSLLFTPISHNRYTLHANLISFWVIVNKLICQYVVGMGSVNQKKMFTITLILQSLLTTGAIVCTTIHTLSSAAANPGAYSTNGSCKRSSEGEVDSEIVGQMICTVRQKSWPVPE